MSQRLITINEIGIVKLQKRKSSKSIRLTVGHDGEARVTMPPWTPYKIGEAFVRSKIEWILAQKNNRQITKFADNQHIGKNHRIKIIATESGSINCRVTKTEIIVKHDQNININDKILRSKIYQACIRALKQEAKVLLPQKIEFYALKYNFKYRSISIKQLKTRWGSCSSNGDIALNCFLMQLPWELIDYVILHELLHTKIMAHGGVFWNELNKYVNDLDSKRQQIKKYQPTVLFDVETNQQLILL